MQHQTPTIGVVIVSFNTRDLLHACLDSLETCTLPLRVVVVDNASSDGSAATVRAAFPHVSLLALEANVGFAAGTNMGLRELGFAAASAKDAPPDLVLLLNPDTVVYPGAIEALVDFMQRHPRVGVAGPRLLNRDGSVQAAAFRFPTLLMTALDLFPPGEVLPGRLYGSWWHGRYPQEKAAREPFSIDHPLGACMLVRHDVLAQVGLLDEAYFMYAEEVDWCFRVRQAGWAIWQVPAAQVMHVGGAATSRFRARMLVALHESRLRFFRAHYSANTVRAHRMIIRAGMLRHMLLDWRDYGRGTLSLAELRERLFAYGQIMQL